MKFSGEARGLPKRFSDLQQKLTLSQGKSGNSLEKFLYTPCFEQTYQIVPYLHTYGIPSLVDTDLLVSKENQAIK